MSPPSPPSPPKPPIAPRVAQPSHKWIVISALVVGGVWFYRRTREPTSVMDTTQFVTAWGASYFTLALIGEAWPGFASAFAILIMSADLLTNAPALLKDLAGAQAGKKAQGSVPFIEQPKPPAAHVPDQLGPPPSTASPDVSPILTPSP